jgi:hypothetical protein
MFQFGIGGIFARPTGGNQAATSMPVQLGTIQEGSLEMSQKLVSLMGQNKWPDDVAPSDMKGSGKSGFGRINPEIFNNLFFADVLTNSGTIEGFVPNEAHTVPGTGPFTITIAPPSTGTFVNDMGVYYAANLSQTLQKVASVTAAGQYSVVESTGVYTFFSADASAAILISYDYTYTAPAGARVVTAFNHIQGYGPFFELFLLESYQANNFVHLYQCRASKLSRPLKRDNYEIPDFEFEFYPNAAGKILDFVQLNP